MPRFLSTLHRVPVSEERVNVTKDTVVTGEVDISKRQVTDKQTVSEELKKEDVRVDPTGSARVINTQRKDTNR